MQSYPSDEVNASISVVSWDAVSVGIMPCSFTVRGRCSCILYVHNVDDVVWRQCGVDDDVDEDHGDVDLGDDVSAMSEQQAYRWCVSLGGVPRDDDDVDIVLPVRSRR
jgi:hypothetical protein